MDGTDSREEVAISWSPAGIAEDAAHNADASSSLLLKRVQDEMPEHDKKCGFPFSKEHKCNLLFNGNTNGIVLQNYDLNERHQDHVGTQLSSSGKAFGNILISIVGSGVLGLPYTFKRTGWLPSTLVLSFVAVLCYYCMMLLVWSRKRLEKERNRFIDSFSDLAFLLYGTWGSFTVDFLLILSQGAFCVAYLIFIGENLTSVFSAGDTVGVMNPYPTDYIKELSDNDESNSVYVVKKFSMGLAANSNIVTRFFSSKAGYIWVVFFFEIALASIGTLTKLAPFSIFADIVNFGSMAVVLEQANAI